MAAALAGSPAQARILVTLRYTSFAIFIVAGLLLYLTAQEYPYPISRQKHSFKDIFFKPIRNRTFFFTILIAVAWKLICSMNVGTGIYGSQALTFVKAVLYLCMAFYIVKVMPIISGKEHDLSTT